LRVPFIHAIRFKHGFGERSIDGSSYIIDPTRARNEIDASLYLPRTFPDK